MSRHPSDTALYQYVEWVRTVCMRMKYECLVKLIVQAILALDFEEVPLLFKEQILKKINKQWNPRVKCYPT